MESGSLLVSLQLAPICGYLAIAQQLGWKRPTNQRYRLRYSASCHSGALKIWAILVDS